LRPGEAGSGQLEIESPVAFDASISVQLLQQDFVVAQYAGAQSLQQGRTIVEFPLAVLPAVTRLDPRNGSISAFLEITSTDVRGTPASWAHFAGSEVALVPGTSWFQLPLERDTSIAPVDAPAAVSLAAAEDLEAFINPGRTQVFEFDLRNDDVMPLRLQVEVENRSAEWPIEVRPGSRFRLAPGESVRLGVLATAPTGMKEGSQVKFTVVAKEAETMVPVAAARIHVIVTTGVEIENETFESSSEDVVKLDSPGGKSPGVGWLGFAIVFAIAVLARRRRG
jgi:MYXO-CTERM domain-containing protein